MQSENNNVKQLLQDVRIPTEERIPQTQEPIPPADENKNTAAKENVSDDIAQQDSRVKLDPLDPEMLETSADMAIELFNLAQLPIFRWLIIRKRNRKIVKIFGAEALKKVEKLIDEKEAADNKEVSHETVRMFNSEELSILRWTARAEELLGDLPLTEKEKDFIRVPLIAIMKTRGGHIPPEYMLSLGIIQIVGARIGSAVMM